MASTSKKVLKFVKDHPVGTVAVGGGVVAGAILVGRAAKTAARVVTIKAAAQAATDVAKAVRGPAKSKTKVSGGPTAAGKRTKKRKS